MFMHCIKFHSRTDGWKDTKAKIFFQVDENTPNNIANKLTVSIIA